MMPRPSVMFWMMKPITRNVPSAAAPTLNAAPIARPSPRLCKPMPMAIIRRNGHALRGFAAADAHVCRREMASSSRNVSDDADRRPAPRPGMARPPRRPVPAPSLVASMPRKISRPAVIAIRNIIARGPSRAAPGTRSMPSKTGITPTYKPISVKLSSVLQIGRGRRRRDRDVRRQRAIELDENKLIVVGFALHPRILQRRYVAWPSRGMVLLGEAANGQIASLMSTCAMVTVLRAGIAARRSSISPGRRIVRSNVKFSIGAAGLGV